MALETRQLLRHSLGPTKVVTVWQGEAYANGEIISGSPFCTDGNGDNVPQFLLIRHPTAKLNTCTKKTLDGPCRVDVLFVLDYPKSGRSLFN